MSMETYQRKSDTKRMDRVEESNNLIPLKLTIHTIQVNQNGNPKNHVKGGFYRLKFLTAITAYTRATSASTLALQNLQIHRKKCMYRKKNANKHSWWLFPFIEQISID